MAQAAHSPVPFPTVNQPSPSRSSMSAWDPTNTGNPTELTHLFTSPAPSASTSTSTSSQKHARASTSPERPSQPHTPLTPPLTPASSSAVATAAAAATDQSLAASSAYATPPARGAAAPPPTPASAGLLGFGAAHGVGSRSDAPPSPVAISSSSSAPATGWPAPGASPTRARASPQRIDVAAAAGTGAGHSPLSARGGNFTDDGDRVVIDLSERDRDRDAAPQNANGLPNANANANAGTGAGGERYLLISGFPQGATSDAVKDALRPCGDATVVKGLSLRFLDSQGVAILAFYDSRHLARAEHHVAAAAAQTSFGNRRMSMSLSARRVAASELRRYTGDSSFVDETEGEVVVSTEGGKIDANSLQHLISAAGELRAFAPCGGVPDFGAPQTYVAEFFDLRSAKHAVESLNGRSIFNIHLRVVPRHAAPPELFASAAASAAGVPFPQNTDGRMASQPSSPLSPRAGLASSPRHVAFNFAPQEYKYPSDQNQQQQQLADLDTTNSSPFHGTRALPLPLGVAHASPGFGLGHVAHLGHHHHHRHHQAHSSLHGLGLGHHHGHGHGHGLGHGYTSAGGAMRRISTGSVNLNAALGAPLHTSASEQDLRRRAALAAAASAAHEGVATDDLGLFARASAGVRDEDVFGGEAMRKVVGQVGILETSSAAAAAAAADRDRDRDRDVLLLPRFAHRARSISESSASPRVISPGAFGAAAHTQATAAARLGLGLSDAEAESGSRPGALAPYFDLGVFDAPAAGGSSGDSDAAPPVLVPSTPEHSHGAASELERALYGDRDAGSGGGGGAMHDGGDGDGRDRLPGAHMRLPTASDDSSRGSPHTPSPPGGYSGGALPGSGLSPGLNLGYYTPGAPVSASAYGVGVGVGVAGHHLSLSPYYTTSAGTGAGAGVGALGSPMAHSPGRYAHSPGGGGGGGVGGACYGGLQLGLGLGGSPAGLAPPSPRGALGHPSLSPLHTHSHSHSHGHSPHSPSYSPSYSPLHGHHSGGGGSGVGGHSTHGTHGHILPAAARSAVDVTREAPSERNQIDLEKIAMGLDTRTTVMIKNIPNKLSDRDLVEYIGRVCPRKIDFCYLRMDFQNGCNVGYAFVNFIYVEDLLHFAKAKLGVKWNMFSSEKVLQMSYANYQGKEALVEKFKNSCVMDEREAWRPKIFYSNGPNQGLPEPFPAPTHFRRKERSAQNRGALFVPGSPGGAGAGTGAGGHGHGHGHGRVDVGNGHGYHGNGGSGGGGERGGSPTAAAVGGLVGHSPFRRPNQHPQNLARHDRI